MKSLVELLDAPQTQRGPADGCRVGGMEQVPVYLQLVDLEGTEIQSGGLHCTCSVPVHPGTGPSLLGGGDALLSTTGKGTGSPTGSEGSPSWALRW